ncbi:MAG: hypothetical protein HY760_06385 [Nitrospirae bacterium]|nr:hypothetical protein [Nitrospirota bacterium]
MSFPDGGDGPAHLRAGDGAPLSGDTGNRDPSHRGPLRSPGDLRRIREAYGRHFGWLYLTEKEGAEEFTELDEQILAALAVHAAAVLENARRLEQLLHAEKLGAVGKLSASIAHEFNNPIYGIRNVLEQLVDRDGGDPRMADLLKLAVGECNRMADLVKNLGDFYRPSSGNWIPTSLHCILEDTLRLMEGKFQTRGIRLAREYAAEMPMIGTIPDQIRQVILNLLMNAEEAIQGEDRRVTIGTEVSGAAVLLRIQDTGGGIDPEHMGRIFEPFFTTKSEVKGIHPSRG